MTTESGEETTEEGFNNIKEQFQEFSESESVFADKSILQIDYVPEGDRIVGRDTEIKNIINDIGPTIRGDQPNNILLFGNTGTGKSLTTRHVLNQAKVLATNEGFRFESVYIDCNQHKTESQVVQHIGETLNEPDETDISFPDSGLAAGTYYGRLWDLLNQCYDVVIIVLDEIDRLSKEDVNDVLYELSRAGESQKTQCHIGTIGLSNKNDWTEVLNPRTLSSFQPEDYHFDSYSTDTLTRILNKRRDAFKPGVLQEGVINKTAAMSARDHGDARKAINILRNSGDIANKSHQDKITEDTINEAVELAEKNRFQTALRGIPGNQQSVLLALALLTKQNDKNEFRTTRVFEAYKSVSQDIRGVEPRSQWTHRDEYLKELAFRGFINSEKRGHGKSNPPEYVHSLKESANMIIKTILDEESFDDMVVNV